MSTKSDQTNESSQSPDTGRSYKEQTRARSPSEIKKSVENPEMICKFEGFSNMTAPEKVKFPPTEALSCLVKLELTAVSRSHSDPSAMTIYRGRQ